jgi:predicted TPR repeat methyltransferase
MTTDAERIIGLYRRHAHAFDRARGKTLFEKPWLDRFRAMLADGPAVLSLGCGSGEPMERHLIDSGARVTGVDSSSEMIALCRDRFPDHAWVVADMRALALERTFDGILAWDSFFHFTPEDQRAMFPIFADHATARAALMFTSGPRAGIAMGEFHGEPLYHASLDPEEYRALLVQHGFEVVRHAAEDPNCGGHTIWLAQRG